MKIERLATSHRELEAKKFKLMISKEEQCPW